LISIVILTQNEEVNLPRCLESVRWSDDVLVLDSLSTDNTVAIAEKGGARVLQRRFDHFAGQRNFAIDSGGLKYDWVLHLDADEVVPPELRDEVCKVVERGDKDAYRIASKLIFQGKWLRYASLFPWYQVRLGRREKLRFHQVGHGQRETVDASRIGTLEFSLLHYSFAKGIHDWIDKHNRYSTAEAEINIAKEKQPISWRHAFSETDSRRRVLKRIFARMPFRPTLRFVYMYILRGGFLDGRSGLTYCRLLSWYEKTIVLKERELRTSDASRD
jgi:glycosyltransferase involved in cell wall biosynthesis